MQPLSHHDAALRALLIDLDHCPKHIEQLPESLNGFARVIACYGGSEPKVPLGLVPLLASAIHDGRLEIIGMESTDNNAADFGLTFWAGRLAAEMPPNTSFFILSQEAHLDHVVHMLQRTDRQAERLDGNAERLAALNVPPAPPKAAPASLVPVPTHEAVQAYHTQHLQRARSRPARKVTLTNSIRAFFSNRKQHVSPDTILQALIDKGIVTIDAQSRVTYLDHPSPAATPAAEPSASASKGTERPPATPYGEGVIPF